MKKHYFLVLLGLFGLLPASAVPPGWLYTEPYLLTNSSAVTAYNYQVSITVNTQALVSGGQMLASGDDIRFGKDCSGSTLYNYWIESGMNTASTVIWVKVDTLYASASRTIFMFYGNTGATAVSSVPSVFYGPHSSTDSVATGGAGGVGNSQRGFRFAPTQDILVTAFGKREPTGTTRYVTLFNFSTQAIISQQQVGGPAAQYSYANIANPIWLTQGTQYTLQLFQGAGDGYYFGTSSQIGQHMTYYDMRYCNSCTQNTFPTNVLSNYQYGYPDMWYWTKNNTMPQPTIVAGAGAGGLTVTAGSDIGLCPGDSAQISGSGSGGSGPLTYSWTPLAGVSSPNSATTYVMPSTTTAYAINVSDTAGCTGVDTINVIVFPAPVIAVASSDDTICAGSVVTLTATGNCFSYTWQPGGYTGTNITDFPTATTTYTITGVTATACVDSTYLTVVVLPTPSISLSSSSPQVCTNNNAVTLTASGATTYSWQPGSFSGSTVNDTLLATTTYTVIGTDNFGCTDSSNLTVTVVPTPDLVVTGNDSVCSGVCVTMTATATGGTPNYSYAWNPPNVTGPTFVDCPTANTCYTVTVTDFNGCTDIELVCNVVHPEPIIVSTGPPSICAGDSAQLNATGSGLASIDWSPASSLNPATGFTVTATPSATTTYTVVGTSPEGCTDTAFQTLIVNQLPNVTFTSSLNTACTTDAPYTLTGGSPAGGTYSGPGVSGTTFTASVAGTGTHTITYFYTDANNCSASATHTISVSPCVGISETGVAGSVNIFPNPFSTGITISRSVDSEVTVNVYDAQGRLVLTKKANGTTVELETSALANGVYSLQLVDKKGTSTFRVVKND
jgi:hypothetical protein